MKYSINRSFSLIEVLVVLALALVLMALSFEIKLNVSSRDAVTKLSNMLHSAQQIALQKQENIYLVNDNFNILVCDQYGKTLAKQKLGAETEFYDSGDDMCHRLTVFASGFSPKYTIKFSTGQYVVINPLSLNVSEIK